MTFVTKNFCWQDESPWNKKFAIQNFETSWQFFFKRKSNDSQPALEITIASKLQKIQIGLTVSRIFITDFIDFSNKIKKNLLIIWATLDSWASYEVEFSRTSFDQPANFAGECPPTETPTQKLDSWFFMFNFPEICSSLVSLQIIFAALPSELSIQKPKNPGIQPINIWPFLTDIDHWILINRQTREFLVELQPKKLKVKPSLAFFEGTYGLF